MLDQQKGGKISNPVGIKTASYLILLKKFDMVEGFSFDSMHTILLGEFT